MARHGRLSESGAASKGYAPEAANSPSADPGTPGIDGARAWVCRSLGAVQGAADWIEQMQRFNLQGVTALTQSLAAGARQAQQADDPYQLMAVPTQIFTHQVQELTRQLGAVMEASVRAQARWAEQLRPTVPASPPAGWAGGWAPASHADPAQSAWNSLGRVQDEWMAITQRWLDAVNAATVQRAQL
jgi:hypothetical protein